MIIQNIDIPDDLLKAFEENRVVVFAGAGVSMQSPSNCPSFSDLADRIAEGTGLIRGNTPIDQFLGQVASRGIDIKNKAAELLSNSLHNNVHKALLRLFPSSDKIKLITTNFDLLFEKCADEENIKIPRIFSAPAMPKGKCFTGLVHLHGDIKYPDDFVLDDKSFGEAYITDSWAARFLTDVCLNYVTVFIGYSLDDIIMKYLIRALSHNGMPRYIITEDDEKSWDHNGFNKIIYPYQQYDVHEKLLVELSNILQQDYFDWKRVVKDILVNPPSNNPENDDRVKYVLNNEKYINIFTEYASDFGWVAWLKERSFLDFLWNPYANLSLIQRLLCSWLAKNFSQTHITQLVLLFGDKISLLHPEFCDDIGYVLSGHKDEIAEPIIKQWVMILVGAAKHYPPSFSWHWLIELGKKINYFPFVWSNASKSYLSASTPYWRDGFSLDIVTTQDYHWPQKDFFQKDFEDYQSIIHECVKEMHHWHTIRELYLGETMPFDQESFRVSAIENHSQNMPNPALYYVALLRDTLLKLETYDTDAFIAWVDILIKDKAPLLKRIAIYVMAKSSICVNKKTNWFLKNINVNDAYLRHEVYFFLKSCYADVAPSLQKRLLNKISKKEDGIEKEDYERRIFSLLSWITTDTEDEKINKILDPIKNRYPKWKISPHEDFGHYHYTPEVPQSPLTKEELKKLSPKDFIIAVEKYTTDDMWNVLSHLTKEIIKEDPVLCCNILKELVSLKECKNYLKYLVCNELDNIDFSIDLLPDVLNALPYISSSEMHTIEPEIRFYRMIIKRLDIRENNNILITVRERITNLYKSLPSDNDRTLLCGEWVTTAINNPYGMITEFFLEDLAEDQKQKLASPNNIPDRYITYFEDICSRKDFCGLLGKTILGMEFSWLLYLMPDFVKNKLCPRLAEEEGVWEGLLSNLQLSTQNQEVLMPYMRKRIAEKATFCSDSIQNDFIRIYTIILWYFYDKEQLLKTEFPKLYNYLPPEKRFLVVSIAKDILHRNSDTFNNNFWKNKLKPFLINRSENKPLRLDADEASAIFDLTEVLCFALDDYLDIMEKIPGIKISQRTLIINDLNTDSELFSKFTATQVGRVILLMLNHHSPDAQWILHGVDNLFKKISPHIEQRLSQEICKTAKQCGISIELPK